MQNFVKEVTLDLFQTSYTSINVAQYDIDSREIIIKLTKNGEFFPIKNSMFSRVKYKKSDGKIVINDCEILDNGTIKVILTEQMTVCDGKCELEIMISDTGSMQVVHTTTHLIVNVVKSVFGDDEISSKNEFTAIEDALLKIDYLFKLKTITKSEIDSLF